MNRAKTNKETTVLFSAIKSLQRKARPNAQKIKINGNITSLHRKGLQVSGNNYDRDKIDYIYSTTDNKLQRVTDAVTTGTDDFNTGGSTADYSYNQMGQLTASVADNAGNISYYSNGLTKQITQTNGDKVNYYYNERGQRIKSEFTAGGATERDITWYVYGAGGNIQAIYHYDEAAQQAGQLTEQPVYGVGGRMGVYKRAENRTLYEIKDHLGNVRATVGKDVDGNIAVDMWADYYPFGGVMPGRNGKPGDYRFGYQGQENAVDSRWSNFKLRMYSADLGRFMSVDPYGQYHSPYLAMADNPVSYIDPSGGWVVPTQQMIWDMMQDRLDYISEISRIQGSARSRVEDDMHGMHMENTGTYIIDGMMVSARAFNQALEVYKGDDNITAVQSSSIVHAYYYANFEGESSALTAKIDEAIAWYHNKRFQKNLNNGDYEVEDEAAWANSRLNPNRNAKLNAPQMFGPNSYHSPIGWSPGGIHERKVKVNSGTRINFRTYDHPDKIEIRDVNGNVLNQYSKDEYISTNAIRRPLELNFNVGSLYDPVTGIGPVGDEIIILTLTPVFIIVMILML